VANLSAALVQSDQPTPEDSLQATVELLHLELAELRRIVVTQGDAADQTAEVLGRTLTQLSEELARLSERLDLLAPGET
jgi:hypothetical protein